MKPVGFEADEFTEARANPSFKQTPYNLKYLKNKDFLLNYDNFLIYFSP